uniref:NACHT LRR and PYD domain-containing protein n=1 Tax=Astyanax mexicanus TaxID=7994 RepID=A0A3B1JPF4_ASTMX
MCHIPVFCWIAATVLEKMLSQAKKGKIPNTLTQMFTHFLNLQMTQWSQKYHTYNSDPDQIRESILALGKLAFQQLEKGNLIFYEEDLKECGIEAKEMSVYSGLCTQIFREEIGLHMGKMYSFVHLSIQELLAALYIFVSFISNRKEFDKKNPGFVSSIQKPTMSDLLKSAVDKALRSKNGHLDLFLRFLLGLSMESNQNLLTGLLKQKVNIINKDKTVKYIKKMIKENSSTEKSINLFHCLNELNDHSLEQEVQPYLSRRGKNRLSTTNLSPTQWSALVFVFSNSEEEFDEFNLCDYDPSEKVFQKLLPVVKYLDNDGCASLASALKSNPSHLRELNLGMNMIGDLGVKYLSSFLKDSNCKLEKLEYVLFVLLNTLLYIIHSFKSHIAVSHPTELKNQGLFDCSITDDGCASLASALKTNTSHLRELNLHHNKARDPGVKLLLSLLKDPCCKLEKLKLCGCNITEMSCAALVSALMQRTSCLRELDMSNNKLQDIGIKLISVGLESEHCKVEILRLCKCNINEQGFAALALALISNPSPCLRELDLSCKHDGLPYVSCRLQNCSITDGDCAVLALTLNSNSSSFLKELDLTHNNLGESGINLLSALVKNPHCKLEKLLLRWCGLTLKVCDVLASALSLCTTCLRELDLSNNDLQDSGVILLCNGLKNEHCNLRILRLCGCNLTKHCCAALASVLSSNSSLRELDLSENNLDDSGVKDLCAGLHSIHCKLETLG